MFHTHWFVEMLTHDATVYYWHPQSHIFIVQSQTAIADTQFERGKLTV